MEVGDKCTCALCGGKFTTTRPDGEALKEAIKNFGKLMATEDETDIVCDDCYQLILPSLHPETLAKAKKEFYENIMQKGADKST
jgi:hypothetical protein